MYKNLVGNILIRKSLTGKKLARLSAVILSAAVVMQSTAVPVRAAQLPENDMELVAYTGDAIWVDIADSKECTGECVTDQSLQSDAIGAGEVRAALLDTGDVEYKDSGRSSIQKLSMKQLADLYAARGSYSQLYSTQPVVAGTDYKIGTLSDQALTFVTNDINYYRAVAGLDAVTLTDALNESAAYGALVLAMNNTGLTHTPTQPSDMSDEDFQKGYAATSSSNISYAGGYSQAAILETAIKGQIADSSSSSNVECLGHRRWLLKPDTQTFGVGTANNGSNYFTDVRVFGTGVTTGSVSDYDFIAWPASGNNLSDTFAANTPWSVTLNTSQYSTPSLSDVTVTLKSTANDTTWTFNSSTGTTVSDTADYFNVNNQGYGVSNCIIFRPAKNSVNAYSGEYIVNITGLSDRLGNAVTLNYKVNFETYENASKDTEGGDSTSGGKGDDNTGGGNAGSDNEGGNASSDSNEGGSEGESQYSVKDYSFTFEDVRKGQVSFNGNNGVPKVMVFGSMNSSDDCGNDKKAMEIISSFVPRMKSSCEVYAFDRGYTTDDVIRGFLNDNGIDATIYCGSIESNDTAKAMYWELHQKLIQSSIYVMPLIIFVNAQGNIVAGSTGSITEAYFQKTVASIVTICSAADMLKELSFTVKDLRGQSCSYSGSDGIPKILVFGEIANAANRTPEMVEALSKLAPRMISPCQTYFFNTNSSTDEEILAVLNEKNISTNICCSSIYRDSKYSALYRAALSESTTQKYFSQPIVLYLDGKGNRVSSSTGYVLESDLENAVSAIVTLEEKTDGGGEEEKKPYDVYTPDEIYRIAAKGKIDVGALVRSGLGNSELDINKYVVENKKVASVNSKGILTGKADGQTEVTAYQKSGKTLIEVCRIKIEVKKPVFKFTKDLTYIGAKLDANEFINNLPEGVAVSWMGSKSNSPAGTVDSKGIVTANKKGSVKITCQIGEGNYAAKYTATVKIKLPKIKEMQTIKAGKTKIISLSNVSKYTDVTWKVGSTSAGKWLEVSATNNPSKVKVKALQSSDTPVNLIAVVDGKEYPVKIAIK